MVKIDPIRVEVEQEVDGLFEAEAIKKAKTIALQVVADMIEIGEALPLPIPASSPNAKTPNLPAMSEPPELSKSNKSGKAVSVRLSTSGQPKREGEH
jgi:hypothetical protein